MGATGPTSEPLAWFKYLSQGETWVPNGKPPLPITDMDATWRYNAANWLLKRAKALTMYYEIGEHEFIFRTMAPTVVDDVNGQPVEGPEIAVYAPRGEMAQDAYERETEEASDRRAADPEAWLKTTTLYQALVAGLPENAGELAKHWSGCGLRTGQGSACSCKERTQ